jgi:hypothetical protein
MQKEHSLSFLDQQPHIRNYGRYVTVFPFPYARRADEVFRALRAGLAATLRQFPFLAGTLNIPDPTTRTLQLLHPDPSHMDLYKEAKRILSVKFLSAAFDFHDLEKHHFDPTLFPPSTFCPSLLINHPALNHHSPLSNKDPYATGPTTFLNNISLPVMAAQVTFIHGGVVLSTWTHHCVADGAGAKRYREVWARNTRDGTGSLDAAGQDRDAAYIALELDEMARSSMAGVADLVATDMKLREEGYDTTTKMLRFEGDKIGALAEGLGDEGTRVSPFIALSALLWAHVLMVRKVDVSSTPAIVVDLRSRLGAPFDVHPDYLGNCVLSARATHHTSQLFASEENLVTILATGIVQSIKAFTKEKITGRMATIINNPGMIDNGHLTFANGPDLYITDVRRYGIDSDWGILGKPVAIRRCGWHGEGGIVVLPRGRNGDWEVMMCLEKREMTDLMRELESSGWLIKDAITAKL